MTSNDPNSFLLGGGGSSAKFDQPGDTVAGTITSTEVREQTDIQTGKPLTWDNGDPRMQLVVSLQTDLRDDNDDDGVRAVYVKGSKKPGSKSLHDAVRAAVQSAGAKGLEVGGTLSVSYVGDEPSQTRGFSPRKLYEARYAAPDKAAQTGGFLGTAPAQQAPAGGQAGDPWATQQQQAPAPQPAAQAPQPQPQQAAPADSQVSAENAAADKARQLINLGLDDATIAGATGLGADVVALLRQAPAA